MTDDLAKQAMSDCPSCSEPLDYPSPEGCAAMTKHKEKPMIAAIRDAVREALRSVGLDTIRSTEFFGTNQPSIEGKTDD